MLQRLSHLRLQDYPTGILPMISAYRDIDIRGNKRGKAPLHHSRAYPPPGLPTDKNQHTRGTVSATHWRSRAEDTLFFRLMQSSPERRQKTMWKNLPCVFSEYDSPVCLSGHPVSGTDFPDLQLHPSVYPAHFL